MGIKIIAKNKRARFDYSLEDTFEAGIMLQGTEVKSLRDGKVSIAEAYIQIHQGEAWAYNINIPHYSHGNQFNHEETRKRKLLLNRKEIERIEHLVKTQRYTIVPTIIYFKRSLIKIEIALGKGKKQHDKRHDQKEKDVKQKLQRGIYE